MVRLKTPTLSTTKIISCGDSFPCGYGLPEIKNSYPSLLARSFDSDLTSLARPGCCNYSVAKQIEYATDLVSSDEDFVLVSTTNEDRIAFAKTGHVLNGGITLEKLNYKFHKKDLLTELPFEPSNEIESETISNILYAPHGILKEEPKERLEALQTYSKYIYDRAIKKDQDIFMLLWKLTKLNQKTKNWVCITNYNEIYDQFPDNTLLINFGALCKDHPDVIGSGHFNEEGHEIVLNKIEEWYIDKIERPYYENKK